MIKGGSRRGDPIAAGARCDGTSLWYRSLGPQQEKRHPGPEVRAGQALAPFAETADVVVENFRPGLMESWGMGPEQLNERNLGLVYARISVTARPAYSISPGYACHRGDLAASATSTSRTRRRYQHQHGRYGGGDSRAGHRAGVDPAARPDSGRPGGGCGAVWSVFNPMEGIVPNTMAPAWCESLRHHGDRHRADQHLSAATTASTW